ncbi:Non-specific serine/threonine protein kinase [Bertholletia excelsa]
MAAALLSFFLFLSMSPLSLSISETDALLQFKSSLSNPQPLDSWVPSTSPCNTEVPWKGVICHRGVVSGLHLVRMGLSGEINLDALLQINSLRTISLLRNFFSGPIPEFNRLGALKALYLSFNNFSGEIPPDFFAKMGSLKKVWLSGNKFSGKIPVSLGQVPHLVQLRMESNEFSGTIPEMRQTSLTVVDFSNNKLEGEIPETFSKFGPVPFNGNPGLCGKVVGKDCSQMATPLPAAAETESGKPSKKYLWFVVAGAALLLVVLAIFFGVRSRKKKNFEKLDTGGGVAEVRLAAAPVAANQRSSSRRSNSGKKGAQGGKGMGDLVVVNSEKGVFGLPDLMKAAAEVLGTGGLGSSFKAVMANGLSVVVKRVKEMNPIGRDAFDAEMRRMGGLRHPNVLPQLAYHYRKEEKLFVSEYAAKGSLNYVLHGDRGITHAELNWPNRLKIIKGIARGLAFLHSEFSSIPVPHGNLKSTNIVLDADYEPLLTDYAFYPLLSATQAAQALFTYKTPEGLHHQISPKSDVFCLGIVVLEILTGKFPSQYLSNQNGGTDIVEWARSAVHEGREVELIDPEIVGGSEAIVELIRVGVVCIDNDPERRIELAEVVRRIEEVQA